MSLIEHKKVGRSIFQCSLCSNATHKCCVDATARLLSDLDACMQFEEDYYEGRLDSVLPKSWLQMDKDLAFDTVDVVVKAEQTFGIGFKNVDERCVVRAFAENADAVGKLRCNDVLMAVGDVEAREVGAEGGSLS